MYRENEIYKIVPNDPVTETQRGRKPSTFRAKVDKTLGSMERNTSFTVWNKVGMTNTKLQNVLSSYACMFGNKTGKQFATKKYKHGVKVSRVW